MRVSRKFRYITNERVSEKGGGFMKIYRVQTFYLKYFTCVMHFNLGWFSNISIRGDNAERMPPRFHPLFLSLYQIFCIWYFSRLLPALCNLGIPSCRRGNRDINQQKYEGAVYQGRRGMKERCARGGEVWRSVVPGEERYEGAVCQGRRGMKERCARGGDVWRSGVPGEERYEGERSKKPEMRCGQAHISTPGGHN